MAKYQILVGSNSLEDKENLINVDRIYMHENYNTTITVNDIALLWLKKPIQFEANKRPVCLAEDGSDDAWEFTNCFSTGWGDTIAGELKCLINRGGKLS